MALTHPVNVDVRRSAPTRKGTATDSDQQVTGFLYVQTTIPKKVRPQNLPLSSVRGTFQLQPKSRLLALPAELRNKIYELALPTTFQLESSTCTLTRREDRVVEASVFRPKAKSQGPSLLLSCKQIYDAAFLLYFTGCTFLVPDPRALRTWIGSLAPARFDLLRNIQYTNDESDFLYEHRARVSLRTLRESFWGLGERRSIVTDGILKVKVNGTWTPFEDATDDVRIDAPFDISTLQLTPRPIGSTALERKYKFEAEDGSTLWYFYTKVEEGSRRYQLRYKSVRVWILEQSLL